MHNTLCTSCYTFSTSVVFQEEIGEISCVLCNKLSFYTLLIYIESYQIVIIPTQHILLLMVILQIQFLFHCEWLQYHDTLCSGLLKTLSFKIPGILKKKHLIYICDIRKYHQVCVTYSTETWEISVPKKVFISCEQQ